MHEPASSQRDAGSWPARLPPSKYRGPARRRNRRAVTRGGRRAARGRRRSVSGSQWRSRRSGSAISSAVSERFVEEPTAFDRRTVRRGGCRPSGHRIVPPSVGCALARPAGSSQPRVTSQCAVTRDRCGASACHDGSDGQDGRGNQAGHGSLESDPRPCSGVPRHQGRLRHHSVTCGRPVSHSARSRRPHVAVPVRDVAPVRAGGSRLRDAAVDLDGRSQCLWGVTVVTARRCRSSRLGRACSALWPALWRSSSMAERGASSTWRVAAP